MEMILLCLSLVLAAVSGWLVRCNILPTWSRLRRMERERQAAMAMPPAAKPGRGR